MRGLVTVTPVARVVRGYHLGAVLVIATVAQRTFLQKWTNRLNDCRAYLWLTTMRSE